MTNDGRAVGLFGLGGQCVFFEPFLNLAAIRGDVSDTILIVTGVVFGAASYDAGFLAQRESNFLAKAEFKFFFHSLSSVYEADQFPPHS